MRERPPDLQKSTSFLYCWLKKRIGKKLALWVTNTIEKVILIFGREVIPFSIKIGWQLNDKNND
jgi:hypothetical protein